MYPVLLVIHVMVTIALIGIILVQRNAGDGMGLSSSSSTSFMSGRAAATFVTRATAVLATLFILTSLVLGILSSHMHTINNSSIMDSVETTAPAATAPASPTTKPAAPEPAKPSVPRPE